MKRTTLIFAILVLLSFNISMACTPPPEPYQNQQQAQAQGQGQSQSFVGGTTTATGGGGGSASVNQTINANPTVTVSKQRELLALPEINPYQAPVMQGGTGYVKDLPNFGIKCLLLGQEDKIYHVLKVSKGGIFSNILIEDIEMAVINGCEAVLKTVSPDQAEKVRFSVQFKTSASGWGVGGGGTIGVSELGATSGHAGTLGILPGYSSTTFNPKYIIKFFLVN